MTKLLIHKPALFFHALILSLSVAWSGYAVAETLSFVQCVNMALQQNPDLIGSQALVSQAAAGLRQAKGNRVPTLTASEDVVGTNDALTAFGLKLSERQATFNNFGAGQFTGPSALGIAPANLNNPGFVHNFDTRLEILAPVYTGGMIEGGIKQARANVEAAQQGNISARQHVIFQVLQAYEGVHAARAFVDVTQQAETAARSLLAMMNNMLKNGTVVKSDLLLAQVRLQDVQVQRLQAQDALDGALEQLHILLGVPFDHPLDVGDWAEIKPVSAPIQTLRQTALENNPGILALRKQTQAEAAKVDMARAAWQPQVGLMLRQDWNDAQMGLGASSYTIGGSVSWVAFDGGVTHAKVDQAQASKNETQARLTQAEAGLAYQVDEAVRKANEAEKQLAEREAALSQIEEAVSLVNKRYANGLTTITEQLDAQAQLDKARADVVSARYALVVQRANLKLALGQLDPNAL
jgi:outer membrane protein TolC